MHTQRTIQELPGSTFRSLIHSRNTEGLPPGWVDAKMHGEVTKLKVIVTPWKKHLYMSLDLQSPPQS